MASEPDPKSHDDSSALHTPIISSTMTMLLTRSVPGEVEAICSLISSSVSAIEGVNSNEGISPSSAGKESNNLSSPEPDKKPTGFQVGTILPRLSYNTGHG